MWQRRVWEQVAGPDIGGRHGGELFPGGSLRQSGCRPYGNRLAARHLDPRREVRFEVVPHFQQASLGFHDLRLVCDVLLIHLLKGGHRLLGVERVAEKIEPQHLPLVWLVLESRG